ncbi:L,D-carboxypeptidase/transpeptidase [uncultured phage cr112_1]|uniref:L,D-carboxypeptidase/transpeptidase n=1 Tax=uncultured phage cr112_1 TaxID=2772072 RepID=A0A7M1RY84_9CAUD|nr:L,D-carboxypeptidase/transpeptidase [uncultured phage cr112_1]QOR59246.1 L,D-carboxypeptidase/transpeptidase [uncultured phage cr112_1]
MLENLFGVMKLKLIRKYKTKNYCIGHLYVNGIYECDTLEDTDRGLTEDSPLSEIQSKKVYGETAIPTGTYKIDMNTVSPKFKDRSWAKFCGGKLPRLIDVPGYSGVLIHVGNKPADTLGCILVGDNKIKGQVINSTSTFQELYSLMLKAKVAGEEITVTIE